MSYEPSFNDAVEFTLRKEGILSDQAGDKGGLTKYGITQEIWNKYLAIGYTDPKRCPRSVADIDVSYALYCYNLFFWKQPGIDKLPRELQGPVFDFVVNSGQGNAVKVLQGLLGVAQDGSIGPVTLAKLAPMQAPALRKLRNDYVTARIIFLANYVQVNPSQVKFIEGWDRRVTSLYDFAY